MTTGAIVSGRRTFELASRWIGGHHDGVPILVLTHHVTADDVPPGSARFYTDVRECAAAARGRWRRGRDGPRLRSRPGRGHLARESASRRRSDEKSVRPS